MGSLPTFNPNVFTGNRPQSTYDRLISPTAATRCSTGRSRAPVPPARRSSRSPPRPRWRAASGRPTAPTTTPGSSASAPAPGSAATTPGGASNGALELVKAIRVSSDNFFYNLGALTNVEPATHPNGGPLEQWATRTGSAARPASTCPARRPGRCPSPAWRASGTGWRPSATTPPVRSSGTHGRQAKLAQPPSIPRRLRDRRRHGPPVVDRRQRQPGRRSGRRAGAPAAAGGGVLGAGQRRHDRASPPRTRRPDQRRHGAAEDRSAALAPHQHQPVLPGDDPDGAADGGVAAGRDLRRRDRQLPPAGLRQDRHRAVLQQRENPTTPGTPATCPRRRPASPSWSSSRVEKGGFGDVGAAPVARQILSQWFYGKPGPLRRAGARRPCEATPIQPVRRDGRAPRADAAAIDPMLLLAAVG